MKLSNLMGLFNRLVKNMSLDLKSVIWTFGAVSLELLGRLLGNYDYYIKKKTPFAWDIAKSTKNLKNVATHT
jgi:hypothetical protein